ncbi:unnamed protein product, partial [Polarella glacialis]
MAPTLAVCNGGSCSGNGSSLAIRDIEEICFGHANVELTGCLGHCGKGPNCKVTQSGQKSKVINNLKKVSKMETMASDTIEGFELSDLQRKVVKLKFTARREVLCCSPHLVAASKVRICVVMSKSLKQSHTCGGRPFMLFQQFAPPSATGRLIHALNLQVQQDAGLSPTQTSDTSSVFYHNWTAPRSAAATTAEPPARLNTEECRMFKKQSATQELVRGTARVFRMLSFRFAAQGQNLLSKKDLKTLKGQLSELFPGLDEKTIDVLLPEGQAKVVKLDNRCLLYSAGDAAPVFFDAEGRGELYPTMHTLWLHPNMMLELTIHPPVSKFVLNGADLMLPGVLVPANGVAGFGTVTKGQPRCIKIEGNPYPIAVGKMLVNQSTMEKLKGKGMEVMHVYKDTLWGFCGKAVPNAGFSEMEDEVTPCNDNSWKPGDAAPAAKASTPAAEDASSAEPAAAAAPATSAPAVPSAVRGSCGAAGGGRAADDWTQDDLLDFTFMQAFKLSLTDEKALPIEASDLYDKHMKTA